ncbi:hypothetical protein DUNSADRAFT_18569 [Dunaliella salina]|uniref:Secreted protein n=1 Tax=Dunaliella salina TaxID=3046 RepID=A0ABQ7GYY2_DUNSA|nr:hypothetical protein DUNSADRAFT_18569 [Dunaliella salina]|eukprot:KAF5839806.1 hypothetical protein DUNSADRAFT_18569 [Dunaliella salina]
MPISPYLYCLCVLHTFGWPTLDMRARGRNRGSIIQQSEHVESFMLKHGDFIGLFFCQQVTRQGGEIGEGKHHTTIRACGVIHGSFMPKHGDFRGLFFCQQVMRQRGEMGEGKHRTTSRACRAIPAGA